VPVGGVVSQGMCRSLGDYIDRDRVLALHEACCMLAKHSFISHFTRQSARIQSRFTLRRAARQPAYLGQEFCRREKSIDEESSDGRWSTRDQ
jgi:hypothetical protein